MFANILIFLNFYFQEIQDFMDEVRKQMEDMKKQSDEMRKLKAIIVKHENRIRALEASQKARDEDALDLILAKDTPAANKINNAEATVPSSGSALAPDEV